MNHVSPRRGPHDDYDYTFPHSHVLAPAIWLVLVWVCMMSMLWLVGYLSPDHGRDDYLIAINALNALPPDLAAQRGALGFSGVTLAITVALSLTSLFWSAMAWKGKAPAYRSRAFVAAILVLGASVLTVLPTTTALMPFTSKAGERLLKLAASTVQAPPMPEGIAPLMLILACVVPTILVAGAMFLLQPMAKGNLDKAAASTQLRSLTRRVRDLDQMLYIGALALVFGTLQLSAGLSVALAKMPKAADLKVQADLCKAIGPSPAASSVFFNTAAQAGKSEKPSTFDVACQSLPELVAAVPSTESLRKLVRGVTLCFGLAFSVLLAAIYVPSLLVLRNMIEPRVFTARGSDADAAAVDPLNRLAAVIATLSPLFAGLLVNTLSGS